jgi:tetratricopeptide (TPR) repeat protein
MRPILSTAPLALLLLLAGAGPGHALPSDLPSARDSWIELRTPSFVLYSDAGEKDARRVAASLERLRSVLGQLNPGLKLTAPNPTYLFVFRDSASFKPYRRVYNGKPVDVGGYFLTTAEANWVVVNGDPRRDETAIIHHELLHSILRNNYPSLPLWFNEGMAELYSTFVAGDREARIGLPIPEHVYWLRRHGLIPLAGLFAMSEGSPDYNEGARRGVFYAESWALVHYLLVGSPEHRLQAAGFLREMAGEQPAPDAFRRAFGIDDAALEREIRAYVGRRLFEVQTVPVQPGEELRFSRRDVPRAEALARLGNLLVSLDPSLWPAAGEHFRAALALDPEQAQALAGTGRLEALSGRPREARGWLERAARRAPDDFVIQYLSGVALLGAAPGPAELRQARASLERAVALQPEFGEAWARLAYAQAEEAPDGAPSAEALRSFETAHRLLPTRTDIAFNLVLSYARSGQRARAREVIDRVLARHGTAEEVRRARAALVQEGRREAEERVGRGDLAGAAARLQELLDEPASATPEQRAELLGRLDDIRHVAEYNRFVDRYNEALGLAGSDPRKAIAILEELVATTREPGQLDQARKVLESLKSERRGNR